MHIGRAYGELARWGALIVVAWHTDEAELPDAPAHQLLC
jgi:hypothetical protein